MRYTLRNQRKIAATYDEDYLKRIISSLNEAFETKCFDVNEDCKPYPILDINDNGHSCGLILFHVIRKIYDVYHLAYKESIS